ncbi:MAG TPA: tetraacyldisaccharide 4'-kinase [Tenuifilaceae bacterium]|nr:tetraacyldisaccharide 4'-kinase [Tenuifilaceae bacterium]HPQ35798.1 tetraacyldisaccharide 4'-kinase [Tenuifilaceae bacterium]
MSILFKILLSPIALIYGAVVKVRNSLFDLKIIGSKMVSRPTICIGNLTVGGTGKTPHTDYLISLLSKKFSVAVLSRGYGRKTKGFRYVEIDSTSTQVGDEPLQLKLKFPEVVIAVDGNRVRGAEKIIKDFPEVNVILLDDAFQHRYIKPGYSILLTDFNNLVTKDYFLPLGRLRDSLSQLHRADCIIVTKCPQNLKPIDQRIVTKELKPFPYQSVFFSWFEYGTPKPVFSVTEPLAFEKSTQILAFAGLANPKPFFEYIDNQFCLQKKVTFPDHYAYSEKKIRAIFETFSKIEGQNKAILTTEKDAARIRSLVGLGNEIVESIYYIPIEVVFSNETMADFNHKIETYVRKSKGNRSVYQ